MKKIIFLLVFIFSLSFSIYSQNSSGYIFSLSSESLDLPYHELNGSPIEFTSTKDGISTPITITTNANWLEISTSQLQYNRFLVYRYENAGVMDRTATITVTQTLSGLSKTINVIQRKNTAIDYAFSLDPEFLDMPYDVLGGFPIEFTSTKDGISTPITITTDANWIEISTSQLQYNRFLVYRYENTGVTDRTATITVTQTQSGLSKTINVIQRKNPALNYVFSLSSEFLDMPYDVLGGFPIEFTSTRNGISTPITITTNVNWLEISTSQLQYSRFLVYRYENTGLIDRTATITVTQTQSGLSKTINVIQRKR